MGETTCAEAVELVARCAWCERYAVGDAWVHEAELDAVISPRDPHTITHGVCPDCVGEMRDVGLSR